MSEAITPMVKQYQDIKSKHEDAILFFRLGDFYEMFNEDAKTASKELEITLTGRGEGMNRMPMCGIPYHAAPGYIKKLIERGYKVAVCEQVEDPNIAKGIVKREVIKVYTPGTVQDDVMLESRSSNYLLSISYSKGKAGLSYADASTGDFYITIFSSLENPSQIIDEIKRVAPSEILLPDIFPEEARPIETYLAEHNYPVTRYKDVYDVDVAQKQLKSHFHVNSLESYGLADLTEALGSAVAILEYLSGTQKGELRHINRIQPYILDDFMYIDNATRRNLELVESIRDREVKGSLLWVIDRTTTPMGGRLLKKWVLQPLINTREINLRLDAVEEMSGNLVLMEDLSNSLKSVFDIERLTARVASGAANGRDLVALKDSLLNIPKIKDITQKCKASKLISINKMKVPDNVTLLIAKAIKPEPPLTLREGGLICDGYDPALDEIRDLAKGGKQWISQLELKERSRTGIKSLKVGYTSVFGYYIEISKANLQFAPSDYIRKQTLVNHERFITPELKEKETLILNAESKMFSLEHEIFLKVRDEAAKSTIDLQEIARDLAELDVLLSFAMVAASGKYCRPVIDNHGKINITGGRHPVVEKTLGDGRFVPNDAQMDIEESRFILITGPNMAGKSTYMRQVALIALMAQIGSFVPASSATLPIVDRIFTRIGAMDDIYSGQSTFMMEMTETANIVNNATSKSLIILDEIGRGTSTFDGMSIAASVSEYIHNKIKAFTLFATHYHEITQLEEKNKGMKNYNTLVKKEGDRVIFMHKIVPGPADQSYGIEVAKLAGLPDEVIKRAKDIYSTLEMVENDFAMRKSGKLKDKKDQIGLF